MNRTLLIILAIGLLVCVFSGQVQASEDGVVGAKSKYYGFLAIACGFGMAIASGLCGLAQSRAIASGMEAIGRQPSAAKDIQTILIIGLALIEALGLYTLVVALVFIFTVNPF